jgi:hypothetical protein
MPFLKKPKKNVFDQLDGFATLETTELKDWHPQGTEMV